MNLKFDNKTLYPESYKPKNHCTVPRVRIARYRFSDHGPRVLVLDEVNNVVNVYEPCGTITNHWIVDKEMVEFPYMLGIYDNIVTLVK